MTVTERMVLDTLHRRYSATVQGGNRRFVVAEHVPVNVGLRGTGRIADFIAQDCQSSDLLRDGRPASARYRRSPEGDGFERVPDGAVQRRVLHGHEVKVSRSDWLTELRDPTKAAAWRRYCDRWWLVTTRGVAKPEEMPEGWGLIVDGRAVIQAPVLDPEPMPDDTRTALLRAVQRTALRSTPITTRTTTTPITTEKENR